MDANRPNRKTTTRQVHEAMKACGGNQTKAAESLGVSRSTLRGHLKKDIEIPDIPDAERSAEEIVAARKVETERLRIHEVARNNIRVKVNMDGMMGLMFVGDPHVDDPGCDIQRLEDDLTLVANTGGMFACNVGDMQNNWVGRLSNLYAEQTVTAAESWKLVEWMINLPRDPETRETKWLYLVGGNHDAWSGQRDPLEWIARQAGAHLQYYGVRFRLCFPNKREVVVNCRHDFKGWSFWNGTHAMGKAFMMGPPDNILSCGHRHGESHYAWKISKVDGTIGHLIRASGYKVWDRYAPQIGEESPMVEDGIPSLVALINPDAKTEAGLIEVWKDPEEAAEYLTWKRSKAGA